MVSHSHYSFLLNHCTYFTSTVWVSCKFMEQRRATVPTHRNRKRLKAVFSHLFNIVCNCHDHVHPVSIQWVNPFTLVQTAESDGQIGSRWTLSQTLSSKWYVALVQSVVTMTLEWRHRPAWCVVSDAVATDSGACCNSCSAVWPEWSQPSTY